MPIERIACCTDFSANSEAAFSVALDMAEKYDARLFLVHVVPPAVNPLLTHSEWVLQVEPEPDLLPQLGERLEREYGQRVPDRVRYEPVLLTGHVSTEILRFLEERRIDLAVLGAFGFSGMGLVLFGSVAKRVSQKAPCSVMIVRLPKNAPQSP